jgi:4-hydroxythreonine-4-phosphate dehydrogenase
MKPIIGITIGDLNGIGPELFIKTFDDNRLLEICTPVLFGSTKVLAFYKKDLQHCNVQFNGIKDFTKLNNKQVNVFNSWDDDVTITPGSETADGGRYAVRSLLAATQCLKDGQIHGIVTLPINKNNTQLPDFKYTGHTPFFKDKFAAKEVCMLLATNTLKVGLLTEHLPISDVSKSITIEAIKSKCLLLQQSLMNDFGINHPKIAVLGLNPHAGDGGLIGKEEKEVIIPALQDLNKQKQFVFGPYAADGFFARRHDQNFDAVLAMYHDQGLIPFKSFDQAQGVNYTAGLSVVRTSPDHGTAYDIAGKGIADTTSFIAALYMCVDIIEMRKHAENKPQKPTIKRGIGQELLKKSKRSQEDVIE